MDQQRTIMATRVGVHTKGTLIDGRPIKTCSRCGRRSKGNTGRRLATSLCPDCWSVDPTFGTEKEKR